MIKNCARGFTLVELIIVISILAILAIVVASNFNITASFNRARDAQRKKDLSRIRVAFEEYFNDKGCYPSSALATQLSLKTNCNSAIFSPWLSSWPCDPTNNAYTVIVEDPSYSTCNKWYKVLTKLENTKDSDIPVGWITMSEIIIGNGISSKSINYGISSSNVAWNSAWADPECTKQTGICYYKPDPFDKPWLWNSTSGCIAPNCASGYAKESCEVACCGSGC